MYNLNAKSSPILIKLDLTKTFDLVNKVITIALYSMNFPSP